MYIAWDAGYPLFFGCAPQGTKAPFATINLVSTGKVIPTMASSLDDFMVQISGFSDHKQGAILAQEVVDHAVGLYHRKILSLSSNKDNCLCLKASSTIGYWISGEKVWQSTATFRLVSG